MAKFPTEIFVKLETDKADPDIEYLNSFYDAESACEEEEKEIGVYRLHKVLKGSLVPTLREK